MVFTGCYDDAGAFSNWIGIISTGCYYETPPAQKKNPFLLSGYTPPIPMRVGEVQKKKESFKKTSQIVISKVGIIEP